MAQRRTTPLFGLGLVDAVPAKWMVPLSPLDDYVLLPLCRLFRRARSLLL